MDTIRRAVLAALLVGAATVGVVTQAGAHLLAFTPPAERPPVAAAERLAFADAGPHAVGVRQLAFGDPPRRLTVWYPATAEPSSTAPRMYSYGISVLGAESAVAVATFSGVARPGASPGTGGPFPLMVLSHGFAISASSYAWLAEHLASHGFVVAGPQHDESLDPAVLWRSTVERPRDIQAVLTRLDEETRPGGDFEGVIDVQTVAVVGHSYGGYAALASAGARLDSAGFGATCDSAGGPGDELAFLCDALQPRMADIARAARLQPVPPGLWPAWSAPRIDAAVSIAGDAAMFGPAGLAEVTVPVLAIGGTADTDTPFEWGTRLTADHVSSTRSIEVGLEGAGHLVFAGECDRVRRISRLVSLGFCSDPSWDRTRAHDLVNHFVTTFLRAELGDDRTASETLAQPTAVPASVEYRAEGY